MRMPYHTNKTQIWFCCSSQSHLTSALVNLSLGHSPICHLSRRTFYKYLHLIFFFYSTPILLERYLRGVCRLPLHLSPLYNVSDCLICCCSCCYYYSFHFHPSLSFCCCTPMHCVTLLQRSVSSLENHHTNFYLMGCVYLAPSIILCWAQFSGTAVTAEPYQPVLPSKCSLQTWEAKDSLQSYWPTWLMGQEAEWYCCPGFTLLWSMDSLRFQWSLCSGWFLVCSTVGRTIHGKGTLAGYCILNGKNVSFMCMVYIPSVNMTKLWIVFKLLLSEKKSL